MPRCLPGSDRVSGMKTDSRGGAGMAIWLAPLANFRGQGAKGKNRVGTLYPSGPWPLRTIAKSSATTHAWSNSCAISETLS